MEAPQLEVNQINSFYGKSHILHGVSIQVKQTELVGLLGRNGAGKSTTLNSIMGVVIPRSGSICFRGLEICGLSSYEIARLGIGLVPEDRRIFPTITVRENLLMGMKSFKKKEANRESWSIERVYEYFPELRERDSIKGGFLSGGEQQMLTIGRTLMGNPEFIMLDEPTEGLAPVIVHSLCEMIKTIRESGTPILLVEQSMRVILELCEKIYVMGKGNIVFEGSPDELEANNAVRLKYLEV